MSIFVVCTRRSRLLPPTLAFLDKLGTLDALRTRAMDARPGLPASADRELWADFLAICDCGGRLAGTESEARAFALIEQRAQAATGVMGRSIPVNYGGWVSRHACLRLPGGERVACHALLRS